MNRDAEKPVAVNQDSACMTSPQTEAAPPLQSSPSASSPALKLTNVEESWRGFSPQIVLERLFTLYERELMSYFLHKRASEEDAKDLAQETWLQARKSVERSSFDGQSKARSWLFSIARHVWFHHRRKNRNWETTSPNDAEEGEENQLLDDSGCNEVAETAHLDGLKSLLRATLQSHPWESLLFECLDRDCSLRWFAENTDIPLRTVTRLRSHIATVASRLGMGGGYVTLIGAGAPDDDSVFLGA